MDVSALLKLGVDPALLLGAFEQRALFREVDSAYYALCRYGDEGWWVYRLEHGAMEHFVNAARTRCTCDGFARVGRCKHIAMIDSVPSIPYRKGDRRRRKSVRPNRG